MSVVSSDYTEDNLALILAGSETISAENLMDSFKYLAKLVANLGKRTLGESGNHQTLIQQLQKKFQEIEGAAERAVQNACPREIAEHIKDMRRDQSKRASWRISRWKAIQAERTT